MKIRVATCQHPVSGIIQQDCDVMLRLMENSSAEGAHIAHFCECGLGGYAGVDIASFDRYDWEKDLKCKKLLAEQARSLHLWLAFGGSHFLSDRLPPHNSVFVVNPRGKLVDRYDKIVRVINPREIGKSDGGDEEYYSNGTRTVVFDIKGVRFGILICADFRKPQLYHHYKSLGVQVMLHSYHNGGQDPKRLRRMKNVWGHIVPATMQFCASNNDMWISAPNTSRRQSCWSSFFVAPDGVVDGKVALHKTGILISEVDTKKWYYRVPHYEYTPIKQLYRNPFVTRSRRSDCRTEF